MHWTTKSEWGFHPLLFCWRWYTICMRDTWLTFARVIDLSPEKSAYPNIVDQPQPREFSIAKSGKLPHTHFIKTMRLGSTLLCYVPDSRSPKNTCLSFFPAQWKGPFTPENHRLSHQNMESLRRHPYSVRLEPLGISKTQLLSLVRLFDTTGCGAMNSLPSSHFWQFRTASENQLFG